MRRDWGWVLTGRLRFGTWDLVLGERVNPAGSAFHKGKGRHRETSAREAWRQILLPLLWLLS